MRNTGNLKDPNFRFEDALLGKVWKRVYGSLSAADKKILLADQRDWLKNRRDACAADYMRQGMDKVHAYCWAVNVRTHALQMIVWNRSLTLLQCRTVCYHPIVCKDRTTQSAMQDRMTTESIKEKGRLPVSDHNISKLSNVRRLESGTGKKLCARLSHGKRFLRHTCLASR